MAQRNWWKTGGDYYARDTNGELIELTENYRDYMGNYASDLVKQLDKRDPITTIGCSTDLVLCQSGTLYRLDFGVIDCYLEVTELGPIADVHDDIVETYDGEFFKFRYGKEPMWKPCEAPVITNNRNLDTFALNSPNLTCSKTTKWYTRSSMRMARLPAQKADITTTYRAKTS
jgi:hypothetical protein